MIRMIGTDHTLADVGVRSRFSFLKKEMPDAMAAIRRNLHADGIVMLVTCNRVEVYVSGGDADGSLFEELCALKGLPAEEYRRYFTERNGDEAIRHLFYLASGLRSAMIAEDQIVTQVGEALAFARAHYFTDNVLEVLFRKAVSAAKKVKTEVRFKRADATAIDQAIRMLKAKGFDPAGRKCMVIGNGEYGRLAALALKGAGADVTVTVRQYHSGVVLIPEGCRQILYGARMEYFPKCEIVVSATASPNCTLPYEKVSAVRVDHPMVLLDFAVPPDIEPSVESLPNITLYNIDDFRTDRDGGDGMTGDGEDGACGGEDGACGGEDGTGGSEEGTDGDEDVTGGSETGTGGVNREAYKTAGKILDEKIAEFHAWADCRDVIPRIAHIREEGAEDVERRLTKTFRKMHLEKQDEETLKQHIEDASGKVISKMLFTLRDSLDEATFRRCVESIEGAYAEEEAAYEAQTDYTAGK